MNRGKIDIGRVKARFIAEPWWVSCPLCPIHTGFKMTKTHEMAIDWKDKHLFKHHANDGHLLNIERARKDSQRG